LSDDAAVRFALAWLALYFTIIAGGRAERGSADRAAIPYRQRSQTIAIILPRYHSIIRVPIGMKGAPCRARRHHYCQVEAALPGGPA
jgi:hypothetical protein